MWIAWVERWADIVMVNDNYYCMSMLYFVCMWSTPFSTPNMKKARMLLNTSHENENWKHAPRINHSVTSEWTTQSSPANSSKNYSLHGVFWVMIYSQSHPRKVFLIVKSVNNRFSKLFWFLSWFWRHFNSVNINYVINILSA